MDQKTSNLLINAYRAAERLPTAKDERRARAIRSALANKSWHQIVPFLKDKERALIFGQTSEAPSSVPFIFPEKLRKKEEIIPLKKTSVVPNFQVEICPKGQKIEEVC